LYGLIGGVHGDVGAAVEVELHLMRRAVRRRDGPCDVGDGPRQHIEI
jgi:hypothetical protein